MIAGTIGVGVEAGSQIASSGSITSPTAVVASGLGNAVGAVVGGAVAAPIAKGLSKVLSTAPTQGTGKAITSLSGKVFPPIGASAGNVVKASTGAVTVLSETAGGVAGAAAATTVVELHEELEQ